MIIALRIVGLLGVLLFGSTFALTFLAPIQVEKAGQAFIRGQVEEQVRERIEQLKTPVLEKAAGLLAKKYQAEMEQLREQLKEGLPERIAAVTARMLDLDCECRKRVARDLRHSFEARLASLAEAKTQLTAIIEGKYHQVVAKLLGDLRIFTGANTFVFATLIAVSFMRRRAAAQLMVPGTLLLVATLVCSYFYLFNQNWFFTIIHNHYVGWGYVGYLGVVFGFLWDVALNRARVTTEVLSSIHISVSPC